jgi:hypothetical protein
VWADVPEMEQETNALLKEVLVLRYFSVGRELQEEAVLKLGELTERIDAFRKQAQERKDEPAANLAFVFLQYVAGTIHFLSMWLHLKKDRIEDAWVSLTDSQENINCGLRLLDKESFRQVAGLLHVLEQVLFPPQVFLSCAYQYGWAKCSICGQVYGECDHLAGKLYMGEMCTKEVQEVGHVEHVAIVQYPDDKALRVPALLDGDKKLCSLTLRIVGENDGEIEGVPILRANR